MLLCICLQLVVMAFMVPAPAIAQTVPSTYTQTVIVTGCANPAENSSSSSSASFPENIPPPFHVEGSAIGIMGINWAPFSLPPSVSAGTNGASFSQTQTGNYFLGNS